MYIAIGPYCWGRAPTVGLAVQSMKKAKPSFIVAATMPYRVYRVTDAASVNEHGDIEDSVKPEKIREVHYVGGQRIVKEKFDD